MATNFQIVKLHFGGPLHLARGKSDYASSHEILHSDTLKSALFAAAKLVGLAVDAGQVSNENERKNDFLDSFTVSSAFPFFDDEYFFPKPKCEMHEVWEDGAKDRKGKKDLVFIGKSFFEEIVGDKFSQKKIEKERHINKIKVLGKPRFGKFVSEKMSQFQAADSDFFIISEEDNVMMRVVVPRHIENENQNPRPYYVERMFFHEKAGLYFFIEMDKTRRPNIENELKIALEMLGESGIGTDRNVGNGQFLHEFSEISLDLPENPTHQILLSLCCPTKNEAEKIANSTAAYHLVKRGGYISSPAENDDFMAYRKKSVFMLDEGSILPNDEIRGVLHDLKPEIMQDHPIWRDGRAFSLPIKPIWND